MTDYNFWFQWTGFFSLASCAWEFKTLLKYYSALCIKYWFTGDYKFKTIWGRIPEDFFFFYHNRQYSWKKRTISKVVMKWCIRRARKLCCSRIKANLQTERSLAAVKRLLGHIVSYVCMESLSLFLRFLRWLAGMFVIARLVLYWTNSPDYSRNNF